MAVYSMTGYANASASPPSPGAAALHEPRVAAPGAASIGVEIPVWDIRAKFGDTNMLVTTMPQGHDLARTLGQGSVALMRGHGCAVAGASVYDAVHTAVFLQDNAKLQAAGLRLGAITYLTEGEVAKASQNPHVIACMAKQRSRRK